MAASPGGNLTEFCLRPSPLLRELVSNPPQLADGYAVVPDGPGLGIELDEEVLQRYRVRY